jgi:hypothetical protein
VNEDILTSEVALALIRSLSGTQNYPFREEGEIRLANVLVHYTSGVGHARAVIEEFDTEYCPTVALLRTSAQRLGEKCRCGIALWNHGQKGCGQFASAPAEDDFKPWPPEEVKAKWKETLSEAEEIMQNAAKHADEEKGRYAAVKQKLRVAPFNRVSDLEMAKAWRDLGFPLKKFMKMALEARSEPLEPQQSPPEGPAQKQIRRITQADIEAAKRGTG